VLCGRFASEGVTSIAIISSIKIATQRRGVNGRQRPLASLFGKNLRYASGETEVPATNIKLLKCLIEIAATKKVKGG
jgi:hypothetical protein